MAEPIEVDPYVFVKLRDAAERQSKHYERGLEMMEEDTTAYEALEDLKMQLDGCIESATETLEEEGFGCKL